MPGGNNSPLFIDFALKAYRIFQDQCFAGSFSGQNTFEFDLCPCHTSNPSAAEVQWTSQWGVPLYRRIATEAMRWGESNVGLVVGATYPEILAEVRADVPDAWFLAPGVGAQGGNLHQALQAGLRTDGLGMLIPSAIVWVQSSGVMGSCWSHAA